MARGASCLHRPNPLRWSTDRTRTIGLRIHILESSCPRYESDSFIRRSRSKYHYITTSDRAGSWVNLVLLGPLILAVHVR